MNAIEQIEALAAEIRSTAAWLVLRDEGLRTLSERFDSRAQDLLAIAARLREQESADRRDAERYRWLRDAAKTTDFTLPRWTVAKESGGFGQCYSGANLDAAIDAAMPR